MEVRSKVYKIKEAVMGWTCSAHILRITYNFLVEIHWCFRRIYEYIFKTAARAIECECVDKIELAQDGIVWRSFVNKLTDF